MPVWDGTALPCFLRKLIQVSGGHRGSCAGNWGEGPGLETVYWALNKQLIVRHCDGQCSDGERKRYAKLDQGPRLGQQVKTGECTKCVHTSTPTFTSFHQTDSASRSNYVITSNANEEKMASIPIKGNAFPWN